MISFKDEKDIVRNMLQVIASDDVWSNISWQKTETKESFPESLDAFYTAIKKVSGESMPECNPSHCDSRIKSFLRHTKERINRSSEQK